MIYTEMTRAAMRIAYEAHSGQLDKSEIPYIFHPIHVAEQMDSESATIVALLHDVVEDGNMTIQELRDKGFSKLETEAIELLTRNKKEDYLTYIKKIASCENPYAIQVKIADLKHNCDLSRLILVTERDLRRIKKYQQALEILRQSSIFNFNPDDKETDEVLMRATEQTIKKYLPESE